MSDASTSDQRANSTGGGDVHDWGPLVDGLTARRHQALEMGGADRVERQRSLDKLTVRERLEILLDPGTWIEYGMLADSMDPAYAGRLMAADGAVTGIGEVDGRRVAVAAYDFTVLAGSMGRIGEQKVKRMRELALRQRSGCSTRPARASSPTRGRHSRVRVICSASRLP
jgi:acetyl-CoA carboxylase carboxyltransferase component